MTVAKPESRVLKTIYTLKSGKCIVVSMLEEECFRLYNEWVNYVPNSNENGFNIPKIIIEKKENNKIVEVCAILVSEISSIQIDDVKRFKKPTI